MSTTASVVVASKTEQPLNQATKLGVVPYGEGRLSLLRQSQIAESAKIVEHYFGGQSKVRSVQVHNGVLEILLREIGDGGLPVEWIEVEIIPLG